MKRSGNKGFALLAVVLALLLLGVAAISMGRRAAIRSGTAANRARNMQTYFSEKAGIEYTKWKLDSDPTWARGANGETFTFEGASYKTFVRAYTNTALPTYSEPILITCRPAAGVQAMTAIIDSMPPRDFYIADTVNDRIRKVSGDTWIISTVAGTGSAGYSGDGGPAAAAKIKEPRGMYLDGQTNMFIADTGNHRIRNVSSASGIITTVAGTGSGGYSGDNIAATNSKLNAPAGVYVDAQGNIFIADTGNDRIRKVSASTGIITTIAGTGSGGYSADNVAATNSKVNNPAGVCVDADGNVFIADTGNHRIRKVSAATGIITTIAGTGSGGYSGDNGPATAAKIKMPWGVSVAPGGDIYIADKDNNRIRKVSAATGIITTVAGIGSAGFSGDGGPAVNAKLNKPRGVRVSIGDVIYIADTDNNRIRKIDTKGRITTAAGMSGGGGYTGDGINATASKLNTPNDVFPDPN